MINAPTAWDPSLEVGDPEIDAQHRQLFTMILDLEGRMDREQYGEAALEAVSRMKSYAQSHFDAEERLMEAAAWPGLDGHRGMHGEFIRRVGSFGSEALADSQWTSLDMLRFLLGWLAEHITMRDREFFAWRAAHTDRPRG